MLNFITWTVSPELFSGFVTIRWYGLMFAIGFIAGYYICDKMFRREGVPENWVSSLFFYILIATIIGARLGHVFFYDWSYYSGHLSEIPKVWQGGLASHGGVIGIMVAIWIYSRVVTKRSMLWTFDRVVVPTGLVAALIRVGNLMNHEIYGGPTSLPWGFRFVQPQYLRFLMNDGQTALQDYMFTVPSHPTQIYEALCYLGIFALCMWMYWKKNSQRHEGLIFGVFMATLFSCRYLIEYVKNVQEPWELTMRQTIGMDQGQLLSLPFIALGVWLIVRAWLRARKENEKGGSES